MIQIIFFYYFFTYLIIQKTATKTYFGVNMIVLIIPYVPCPCRCAIYLYENYFILFGIIYYKKRKTTFFDFRSIKFVQKIAFFCNINVNISKIRSVTYFFLFNILKCHHYWKLHEKLQKNLMGDTLLF